MRYLAFYLVTFLFSFLHELAHAGAAKLCGCSFSIGTAGIFGNVVYVQSEGRTVFIKTFIQIAGPAFNLLVACGGTGLMRCGVLPQTDAAEMVVYSNIMLAAFNLLPFFSAGRRADLRITDRVPRRRKSGEDGGHFFFQAVCSFYFLFRPVLGKI